MSAAWCSRAGWLTASLLLAACGGNENAVGKPGDGNASTGGSGNNGAAGGTSAPPDLGSVCEQSDVGNPRLRRLSRDELTNTLADVFPGAGSWSVALSAQISDHGFDNDSSVLVVGNQTADELDRTGDAVGSVVSGAALATLLPCSASSPDAACAQTFIDKYGKRLFHRALTAEESGRYLALFNQVLAAKGFATGIRYVTRALVQSPFAVYRSEIGVADSGAYTLSPSELATELAYDFSGSAPSDELLAQAEAGQLSTPAALEAKARELLLSERGLVVLEKFFNGWLGYGRIGSVVKPGVQQFDTLRDQMVAETRRFIGEVVVNQNGGLYELLTAPYTTPSATLASFYGFPAPASDYAVSTRPSGRGIGLLAQGALLATLAGPSASSPTKRGLLVMERFLCRQKPQVPPGVPPLSAAQPGQFTTRQHYEQIHAAQQPCKGCHALFDPIGFGFEHFDEVGRYRDQDGGLPVDSASYIPGTDGASHWIEFNGLEELAVGLASKSEPYECTTGYMSTYINGAAESCLGETKRAAFIGRQATFVDYLASLAAEPHFSQRRVR